MFGGSSLFSGGGMGNSSSTNTTNNNQTYAQSADYGKYSGYVTSLNGLVLGKNASITLSDQGAIGQAFNFAGNALSSNQAITMAAIKNSNNQQAAGHSVVIMGVALAGVLGLVVWAGSKRKGK